jgi:hypothetical protein
MVYRHACAHDRLSVSSGVAVSSDVIAYTKDLVDFCLRQTIGNDHKFRIVDTKLGALNLQ